MEFRRPLRYEEEIDAPFWLMAVLGASMLALLAAVVAVALDPEAGWQLFVWYYPLMTLVAVLLIAVVSLLSTPANRSQRRSRQHWLRHRTQDSSPVQHSELRNAKVPMAHLRWLGNPLCARRSARLEHAGRARRRRDDGQRGQAGTALLRFFPFPRASNRSRKRSLRLPLPTKSLFRKTPMTTSAAEGKR